MHQYLLISSLAGLWLPICPLRLVGVLQGKIDHRNEKSKEEVEQEIVYDEIVFPNNMLISINIFVSDNDQFYINNG